MSDTNIKYVPGTVVSRVASIRAQVHRMDSENGAAFDKALSAFDISKCEEAESVRAQIAKEKAALKEMTAFYDKLLNMIMKASVDVGRVEDSYAKEHVTK